MTYEIRGEAADLHAALASDHEASLVAPRDDMWALIAEQAERFALVDGEDVGACFSVDGTELCHFFVPAELDGIAEELFGQVVREMALDSVVVSTVDPALLSLSLGVSRRQTTLAYMFEHVGPLPAAAALELRTATEAETEAVISFAAEATGDNGDFLRWYVPARIDRQELGLLVEDDTIAALGECRVDQRVPGYAHLGVIVGRAGRGQGVGTQVMRTLVHDCARRGLRPLCSTEPDNVASVKMIRRAGFVSRHRVFRLAIAADA